MIVKWRNAKHIKPQSILDKYSSIISINKDGSITFTGMEYYDVMATLQGMVRFPLSANGLEKDLIVSDAIKKMAKKSTLNAKEVMNEINMTVCNEHSMVECKYHVLTSLSVHNSFPIKNYEVEDCRFRLFDREYPKKYSSRSRIIRNNFTFKDNTPNYYAKAIVSLKAKSVRAAASKALDSIDIIRSIWCLFNNSTMEYFSNNKWYPINKIRLGEIHTIHKENGKSASDELWYEPNFVKANLFSPNKPEILRKNFKWAMDKIGESSYEEKIKKALLRYVRALDEKDYNVALIKLWGALEELTSPSQANYDLITKRVSFLFVEREYHKQVLENLREYRNRTVHSGEYEERARHYCFQLQYYFFILVQFHMRNANEFSDINEANRFLDFPHDKRLLEKQKVMLEKAIKFVSD
ncbi:MAG: hypothetical protein COA81_09980 [Alphaproteobacteria bacterium]|nr:MAG: hypothetical protein COA81_09980 [Alphaproteobacteria bacterium]